LLAAGGYEALQCAAASRPGVDRLGARAAGTVVSALAALVTVRWLLRFVQTHNFVGFGWYRIALGLVILVALRGSA
jgi:undecaprenyl-diphosphatase